MTFYIYMIGIADNFISLFMTLFIIFIIWVGCIALEELPKYYLKIALSGCLLFGFIAAVTPDSKTLAAMYLIPKLVENDGSQKIPDKALKVLNLKLDEWVKDLSDNNDKSLTEKEKE